MIITEPGFYDALPMDLYVADPAPEPSLSTNTVHTFLHRSALHAYTAHPRLGGRGEPSTARGDIGSAIHSLTLGGAPLVYVSEVAKRSGKEKGVVFTPEDWLTADAKERRDEIRAAGGIPLLENQRECIERASENASKLLAAYGAGKAEQTLLWRTAGAWCRGRADFLPDDVDVDIDLKTTENADAADWFRRCVISGGLDIQAGLRSLGHEALGRPRAMLWLLVEIEPPYAARLVHVPAPTLELARRKCLWVAERWRACVDANSWPSYPAEPARVEPSAWAEMDFAARTGLVPA